MKKVILFAAVLSAMSFASCVKERDCKCTVTYTSFAGGPSTPTTETTTYKDVTKKQAKTLCVSSTTSDADGTTTRDCALE